MSEQQRQPTEEELRAAYEAEIKRVRVEDVVVQTVVSLINLGGRKAGLAAGTEDERDPDQTRQAIEAVRALMPLVEPVLGPDLGRVRDALSQLQIAYARMSGEQPPAGEQEQQPAQPPQPDDAPGEGPAGGAGQPPAEPQPGGSAGPAQRSGRLWVPGQ